MSQIDESSSEVSMPVENTTTSVSHGSSPLSSPPQSIDLDAIEAELSTTTLKRPLEETESDLEKHEPKRVKQELILWADKRQGLCETIPNYNAYKGAVHTADGVAIGWLLDREAEDRDIFGAQVIITASGGGRTPNPKTGRSVRTRDQTGGSFQTCHQKALEKKTPIVVIAGKNHPKWPGDTPEQMYSVLGHFHITDVITELRSTYPDGKAFLTWVVRFERIDLDSPSWWAPALPADSDIGSSSFDAPKAPKQSCEVCKEESKQVFVDHWTCLNKDCTAFFKFPDGVDHRTLQYNAAFLNERTAYKGDALESLVRELPRTDFKNLPGLYGTEKEYRARIVCPGCHCCSSRLFWTRWECDNPRCDFVLQGNMQAVPDEIFAKEVTKFRGQKNISKTKTHPKIIYTEEIPIGRRTATVHLLTAPAGHAVGSVVIIPADDVFRSQPNGPNDIFRALETVDLGNKRNAVVHDGLSTEGLTRNFGQNYGAFYKYGVHTQSKSFAEAPDAILMALQLLAWAGNTAVQATQAALERVKVPADVTDFALAIPNTSDVRFNELLHLSYMEGDRIKHHDDGEKQLGPTVACLSLGSPARMTWRPKKDVVFPGLKQAKKRRTEVLWHPLYHGDLIIMHGTGIHGVFEHGVEPHGIRRFALTGRRVRLSQLKPQERAAALVDGEVPPHAAKWAYSGDGEEDCA